MKRTYLGVLAAAVAILSTAASAEQSQASRLDRIQLPPPFGAPGPVIPGPPQCTTQYQKLIRLQVEAIRQLQRLSRGQGETLCSSIEGADELGVDKFLDPKMLQRFLTPEQRDALQAFGIDLSKVDIYKIMRLFGVDLSRIDLRQLKSQCRLTQGEVDRFATTELGRLEREWARCDDHI
jgi:hypothetical protein